VSPVPSRLPAEYLPLLTKIARMYHEQGLRQPEIADRLRLSQSRVSRLLKEAVRLGVVRTVVVPPSGTYPELEEAVRDRFGMTDVVVAGASEEDSEASLLSALGAAGAAYLETTLKADDRIGISSWSASLISVVDSMLPRTAIGAQKVIQLLGGVGVPQVQMQATRLTERLASVVGATPVFFPAPGIVASDSAREAILSDPYIAAVAAEWDDLTVALVGIGGATPSHLLAVSGNAVPGDVAELVRRRGGVGDVCLRYFDADGTVLTGEFNDRILGLRPEQLKAVPRRIGVAGGARKHEAILGALRGGWVDVLVTDSITAERLASA